MDAIAAAHVICKAGSVLSPGWVGFENGVIREVGSGEPPAELNVERGGPRSILMPGLVSAHAHLALGGLRHVADDAGFMEWILRGILPGIERVNRVENGFLDGALQSARELLEGGVTLVGDSFLRLEGVFALRTTGQKGVFFQEVFGSLADDDATYLEETMSALDQLPDQLGGFPFGYSPHTPWTCPAEVFRATVARARVEGRRISTHLAESEEEHRFFVERRGHLYEMSERKGNLDRYRFGMTPVAYLDQLGILGPDVVAAHGVQATADDIEILAGTGTWIVHCPTSNLKLAEGIAPVAAMLDAGVNVALGTDSAASTGKLDLFEEMRTFVHVQRGAARRTEGLSASVAIDLATRAGAAALGLGDVTGTLEAGKAADVILIEADRRRHGPWDDPEAVVVYTGTPDDVVLVVVDGAVRHRRGSLA
ncbi:MAG: hypothetical protein CMJ83_08430 [Planctomycetes bacterium]|nr:hypothetical protein [Planctomycetota bacterium]